LRPGCSSLPILFFFFFTLVTGSRRFLSFKLSDTRVYEPQIRARIATTAHFCRGGNILKVVRNFACKKKPEPGFDGLMCAIFARQRLQPWKPDPRPPWKPKTTQDYTPENQKQNKNKRQRCRRVRIPTDTIEITFSLSWFVFPRPSYAKAKTADSTLEITQTGV